MTPAEDALGWTAVEMELPGAACVLTVAAGSETVRVVCPGFDDISGMVPN